MRKIFTFIFVFAGLQFCMSQQLNCEVIINAEQTGQNNLSVFKTLERALTEFVNQTTWTERNFLPHERINCSMFITITSFEGENFNGTIQVQSSRPVYGSSMITPVFNFNDEQFSFSYREYQPLNYSQNTYTSNLISVISFYVYTILGLDADTQPQPGLVPALIAAATAEGYDLVSLSPRFILKGLGEIWLQPALLMT